MAAAVQGTAHIFGIGAEVTNMTITGITASHGFELETTVEDQVGVTKETRKDNRRKELTITGRVQTGYTAPTLGDSVTVAGLDAQFNDTYELKEVGGTYEHTDYVEIELTIEKYEGVSVT
jgi:hypothetical protein